MPKHDVKLSLVVPSLSKIDTQFDIKSDGVKLGTLKISKGSIDYIPAKKQKVIKMPWAKFHKLMTGE